MAIDAIQIKNARCIKQGGVKRFSLGIFLKWFFFFFVSITNFVGFVRINRKGLN